MTTWDFIEKWLHEITQGLENNYNRIQVDGNSKLVIDFIKNQHEFVIFYRDFEL